LHPPSVEEEPLRKEKRNCALSDSRTAKGEKRGNSQRLGGSQPAHARNKRGDDRRGRGQASMSQRWLLSRGGKEKLSQSCTTWLVKGKRRGAKGGEKEKEFPFLSRPHNVVELGKVERILSPGKNRGRRPSEKGGGGGPGFILISVSGTVGGKTRR